MTLTILGASAIADVDIVAQVSHVKVRCWNIAVVNPVRAVHCCTMLDENGSLACVPGLLVPHVEHSKIIVVNRPDFDGLPLV